MDSQEGSRLPPADSSEQNAAMVKQSASLPPAFQVRPQGPPPGSPRFPTNNGSGGPRLGPQPPTPRRLDSRSSLVTGPDQRPFGPTSPQGPPIRPQGFPQRSPQPQIFPGQNQGFPNSPGGGPPRRFPSGPPQGPRPQNQQGPRSLATAGQPQRPQGNQAYPGLNSLQFNNTVRPQAFPQRTSSQSSIHSDSPEESRPGTPSSGGKISAIFPQRQLMSGPEGLPPQTNFEPSRDSRNDFTLNSDSPLLRNPSDPRNVQNSSPARAGELKTDIKLSNDSFDSGKKPEDSILGNNKAGLGIENLNDKHKAPINNDDDDDVVFDSDSRKTPQLDEQRLEMKNGRQTPSKSPDMSANAKPANIPEHKQLGEPGELRSNLNNESAKNHDAKARTPEPGPLGVEAEVSSTAELPAKAEKSEAPIPKTELNMPSPIPPKSLESTPGNSPKPRSVPAPLSNQEFDERLSVSGSSEPSPKSMKPNAFGIDDDSARSMSTKSPSPNPPKSPVFSSQSVSPNPSNHADSPAARSPVPAKSPVPVAKSVNPPKSPGSTPQSPNPPKSPGCLRSSEGEKSGWSTPDTEAGKKRATFAKDLIMTGTNKDDESAASTLSDLKDFELTTPEESSKGTPTTPSKGTPGTPRKSFPLSADRSRHRSRSPKSDKGKSPEKESAASRNRTAWESKERGKASADRSKKTEGDNDSGVDESTQGNELTTNGDAGSPTKAHSKIPGPKRSTSSSPTKSPSKSAKGLPKTPDSVVAGSASADKKKVPMNKIQVGAAPSPNLKTVRSKIGSLENTSYKPGGGKIKIENRKLDFSKAQPKIAAKNDKYTPSGGDKKITQVKLQWNAKPKVGSLENSTYKPGGGDKKIETVKLDFKEKAKPKVASKDNVKHVPGGGTVKSSATPPETPQKASDDIETLKIEVKAESKVGSMDNVKHKPGGGDKKIFNDKDYLRQTSSNVESLSGSGSQENRLHGNVVLNVISPSPARKVKKIAEGDGGSTPSSHKSNATSPVSPTVQGATTARPKSRTEQVPVPPTTTPVDEKKEFPQSRKSSLVKTPDRSKTPDNPKKVTIAETQEVREIEMKEKEKRPSTPRHENSAPRTPDSEGRPTTPRTKSPMKKSPSDERQKSPRKKSASGDSPASSAGSGKGTPRKERSSPPNSLPLNAADGSNDAMLRKSSSKEFRLPKIVSSILPELSSQDPVVPVSSSDSKIALPKLVDTPPPPSRTGMAQ